MQTRIATLAVTILLIAGCSQSPDAVRGHAPLPDNAPLAKDPPITAETHFAAGQVEESQNNAVAAVQQYEQTLELKPKHLGALYRLGVLYAELKQYPKAVGVWDRYVEATGETATAYADLAFCQELAGQPEKAEAAYLAGIARDPRCVPCRVNYGLMLARRGRIDDAVVQWRAVLSEAEIHYNLGSVYASRGDKEQARLEYDKALELDPKLTDAQSRVEELVR